MTENPGDLALAALRFERDRFRLGPIDLVLPHGRRSVLLGPSGCGKTTLLRLLAGLERPAGGSIAFADRSFAGSSFMPAGRRRVAMLFQGLALWPHMSAVAQIRFAGRCSEAAAHDWLNRVGLQGLGDRLPSQLSGGEGQRVALARALAQEPELLLLDEPLRSVDPHLRADLQRTIRALTTASKLTTVIVTHDREEALALGEHLVVMRGGAVVEAGPLEELYQRPTHSFTARFLHGAALVPLAQSGARLRCTLGAFDRPPHVTNGAAYLALAPGEAYEVRNGQDALFTLYEVMHGSHGWLGEVEVDGVRVLAKLPSPVPVGTRIALALAGPPRIVGGDAGGEG